jgi:hypothetical protein
MTKGRRGGGGPVDLTAQSQGPGGATPTQPQRSNAAKPAKGAASGGGSASGVPPAPSVGDFYAFLGGKKPQGPADEGAEIANMLDELDFAPPDDQFGAGGVGPMDFDGDLGIQAEPPKPKEPPMKQPGEEGFVAWTAAQLGKLGLAE